MRCIKATVERLRTTVIVVGVLKRAYLKPRLTTSNLRIYAIPQHSEIQFKLVPQSVGRTSSRQEIFTFLERWSQRKAPLMAAGLFEYRGSKQEELIVGHGL